MNPIDHYGEVGIVVDKASPRFMNEQKKKSDVHLPQVKLKSNEMGSTMNPFTTTTTPFQFGATSNSIFRDMKKQMMDRIVSKSNLHNHLKHKHGRPDGTKYGTIIPKLDKGDRRSKSVVPPSRPE